MATMNNDNLTDNQMTGASPGSADEGRRKKRRLIAIIIAVLLVICAVAGFFVYNNVITAVTMRIQRLVGTVNLYNESGAEQSLREKMRLGAGQTVTTGGESLIMVSLDDTKLMTMEESSRADIKARGKKLQFDLIEGNLFFNVTEKLKDDEEFEIHTSTMICGIRGTSAYVGKDATGHEILMVTDGLVGVVATNPVTNEATEVDVPAGQMITIYLDDEAEGNKTISIRQAGFKEEDLPALALDTMRKNKALMERVTQATGFSEKKLATLADLSSTKGVSMFGSAASELAAEGVEDAIPYMGNRAREMVSSANSAVNIAKDDLPLEVAIIQGYRDVMDVGTEKGYDDENLGQLMAGTRDVMERTFDVVDRAGLGSIDRINVATRVSNTLKSSAGRMADSNLTTGEIEDVLDAEAQLFEDAVDESAGNTTDGSKGADVLDSIDDVSDHVTGTVDEEMKKESNGDETVDALLNNKSTGGRKSSNESSASNKKEATGTDSKSGTGNKTDNKKSADANANDTAAAPATGRNTATAAAAGSTGRGGRAASSGGATAAEIRTAQSAIVYTNPANGVVALADGTLFDPVYYAAANPDVVAKYGTSTEALLAEWLKEGKAQGRPPIAPTVAKTEPEPTWTDDSSSGSDYDPYSEEEPEPSPTPTPGPTGIQPDPQGFYNLNGNTRGEFVGSNDFQINYDGSNKVTMPLTVVRNGNDTQVTTATIDDLNGVNWSGSAVGTEVTGDNIKSTQGTIRKTGADEYSLSTSSGQTNNLTEAQINSWITNGYI